MKLQKNVLLAAIASQLATLTLIPTANAMVSKKVQDYRSGDETFEITHVDSSFRARGDLYLSAIGLKIDGTWKPAFLTRFRCKETDRALIDLHCGGFASYEIPTPSDGMGSILQLCKKLSYSLKDSDRYFAALFSRGWISKEVTVPDAQEDKPDVIAILPLLNEGAKTVRLIDTRHIERAKVAYKIKCEVSGTHEVLSNAPSQ